MVFVRDRALRIAIIGSSSNKVAGGVPDLEGFRTFCENLGALIAQSPHEILVGSDNPRSADWWVVQGILNARQPPEVRITVYHRTQRQRQRPFTNEAARFGIFRFESLPERLLAPAHLRMLKDSDVAIVIGGGGYAYPAGQAAAFMGVRLIPVETFGGAGRQLWQQFSEQFDKPLVPLPERATWEQLSGDPGRVLTAIKNEIDSLPRLMLVHGRSNDRNIVSDILVEHGFSLPRVLREQFKPGQTIPEKFELEALQADAAVVLFTPDDEAASLLDVNGDVVSAADVQKRARARQNVSLEYGWFWGRLGRRRVLLLLKGELELPSDLAGLQYESYQGSPLECASTIINFARAIRMGSRT